MELVPIKQSNKKWMATMAALKELAGRDLPTTSIFKVSRRIKLLAPHTEAIEETQQKVIKDRAGSDGQVIAGNTKDMAQQLEDLFNTEMEILCLPPLTKGDMPVEKKDLPANTKGVAAIAADLGPFFAMPEEEG